LAIGQTTTRDAEKALLVGNRYKFLCPSMTCLPWWRRGARHRRQFQGGDCRRCLGSLVNRLKSTPLHGFAAACFPQGPDEPWQSQWPPGLLGESPRGLRPVRWVGSGEPTNAPSDSPRSPGRPSPEPAARLGPSGMLLSSLSVGAGVGQLPNGPYRPFRALPARFAQVAKAPRWHSSGGTRLVDRCLGISLCRWPRPVARCQSDRR
jgi:hypothetical protein